MVLSRQTGQLPGSSSLFSVIFTFVALVLIVIYYVYAYSAVFSKFKGRKAGRMVDRLLSESDTKRKTNQSNAPPDDDIHRFNELLDIIDRPVNTDDNNVPHRQNLVGPTQSIVEVHNPQLAPQDPEEAAQLEAEKESQCPGVEMEAKYWMEIVMLYTLTAIFKDYIYRFVLSWCFGCSINASIYVTFAHDQLLSWILFSMDSLKMYSLITVSFTKFCRKHDIVPKGSKICLLG